MSTLLSLIGENERSRIRPKNLNGTDDVTENGFSSYLDDYGLTAIQDYSNDVNTESPSVSEVGDIALRDRKDYNVFPQDTYSETEVERIDVSVIDMPEIDEISEDIYISRTVYNKYSNLEYIPTEILDAVGVQSFNGDYGDYIGTILSNLEQRGNTLADIFVGRWNLDDSPIGVIGGEALNRALAIQFQDGVSRKVVGILNKNVLSLLEGDSLIREDYEITNPKNRLPRAAEFAAKLVSLENPISYLPEDVFNFNRIRTVTNGKTLYIGSDLTYKDQVALILQYTGKGQEKQLLSLVDLNIYKNEIEGRTRTIRANMYANFIKGAVNSLDNSDFIVKGDLIFPTYNGYYEPYGIISRHKNNDKSFGAVEKQLFSDGFWFVWTTDPIDLSPTIVDESLYSIGWVKRPEGENKFKQKSLLYKTQELVNSQQAFLDLSKKEFTEIVDGETRTISRGDGTTASADFRDENGNLIQEKGEYFRVWTKQRGYNRLDRTLRHRGLDNGEKRSVLNDNGIPNFAPTIREANRTNGLASDEIIKRYMFSLENLAWNDYMDDLPECEQGPGDPLTGTRGRIMWFPPYALDFDETVNASWNPHEFIGRGEKIYTYTNTERTGNISFKILVDHPDIIHIPSLVGEKTQFWERYFKGDKLVEAEALKRYKELTKLSQKELDEIKKIQTPTPPRFKKVPVIVKPKKEVENKKAEEVKKEIDDTKKKQEENKAKEEQGGKGNEKIGLGELLLSVYFPNDETTVPLAPVTYNYSSESDAYTVDKSLSLNLLQKKNYGYEGGVKINGLDFISTDGYIIDVTSGLKYKKKDQNTAVNINYTYKGGFLASWQFVCDGVNPPQGYKDRNNLELNSKFYFEWQSSFLKLLKGVKKAEITIIGNASGAIPVGTDNNSLASGRANNVKEWFDKNVIKLLNTLGQDTKDIKITVKSQGDLEDVEKKQKSEELEKKGLAGISFCKDCDESDKEECKKTRRVDIFVKILDEAVIPPDPVIPPIPLINPSGSTIVPDEVPIVPPIDDTIEDLEIIEELVPDDTQDNLDPNGNPIEPTIDPAILRKLIYTECDFFKYLETNQPFTYQTLSEKIKYFTPAFHSITPQGFNSRLTFLHQCTRQGDSIGMDGVDNIKNLAFGRPPVCILRIGDFFHVKIIIDNLSIKYAVDTIKWDTNPEGIGVQPMVADITLGIKIIGGMSLTAPINRLQNALSFNFYANTEMYDARADSVVFEQKLDKDGKLDVDATYGAVKAAKIVDGIKLSSLVKLNEAQKQARLAKIRLESRLTLQNSTDAIVPTEKIQNLGTVESLLELKKRSGLPLTEKEKIDNKVEEVIKDKFQFTNLAPIDSKNIKITMAENLKTENSLLNEQAKKAFIDTFNPKKPDDVQSFNNFINTDEPIIPNPNNPSSFNQYTNFFNSISQYTQASVSNPNDITEEDQKRTTQEYLKAYGKVWVDLKTLNK